MSSTSRQNNGGAPASGSWRANSNGGSWRANSNGGSWRANVGLFVVALLLPLLLFEAVLRATTLLDQLDRAAPAYIPRYLRKAGLRLDREGFITAEGFRTDTQVSSLLEELRRVAGCKIVVLGDSFVWGAGLRPQQRWTSKLERLTACRVFPVGKRGWSSLEYFSYYETQLRDLEFDYLLVGVVSNDPHPRGEFHGHGYAQDPLIESDAHTLANLVGLESLGGLRSTLRVYDFIDQIVKNVLDSRSATQGSLTALPIVAYGYQQWENRLYEDDIYAQWTAAVRDFSALSRHKTGFLLTPTGSSPREKLIWDMIAATLTEQGATFRNVYPLVDELFAHGPRPRSAWANPADAHPGEAQTTLYAQQGLLLLEDLGYSPGAGERVPTAP